MSQTFWKKCARLWLVLGVVLLTAPASVRAEGPVLLSDEELGEVVGGAQLDFEVSRSGVVALYGNQAKNLSFSIGAGAFSDFRGLNNVIMAANSYVNLEMVVNIVINPSSGLL